VQSKIVCLTARFNLPGLAVQKLLMRRWK